MPITPYVKLKSKEYECLGIHDGTVCEVVQVTEHGWNLKLYEVSLPNGITSAVIYFSVLDNEIEMCTTTPSPEAYNRRSSFKVNYSDLMKSGIKPKDAFDLMMREISPLSYP